MLFLKKKKPNGPALTFENVKLTFRMCVFFLEKFVYFGLICLDVVLVFCENVFFRRLNPGVERRGWMFGFSRTASKYI